MGIHSICAAAHTHTLAKGSHISPGGDRGRMAGLTQTHWRARTTHALTLVRPRSSQHTVRPQAYLARTHDRRGTRSPWPPSLVAAHVDTPSGTLPYQACRVGHAVRTYRPLTRISDPPLANTRPDSPDSHPRAGQAALARSSPLPTPGWPAISSHHGQSHGRHSNTSRACEADHTRDF